MPPQQFYGAGNTWLQWTDTTTAATSISSLYVWDVWTQTNSTASSSSALVWAFWNNQPAPIYGSGGGWQRATPPLSAEELARRTEEKKERERLQIAAKARARALLLALLDDEQRKEFESDGHFHVQTKDGERVYRLKPGKPPLRIKGEDGSRWSYCIHPRDSFPADDTTAALKLMIEAEEERFLRVANATRVREGLRL